MTELADPSLAPAPHVRRGRHRLLLAGGVLLAAVMAFLWYVGEIGGNVHAVVPGRVFRSATLWPEHLAKVIREHGIRTVISLRGGEPSNKWFRREQEVCRKNGAMLRAVHLRATALPPPAELGTLLSFFDHAEYPIIFHCRSGADRTGLATTLYLALYEKIPLDEAQRRGLSWRYGHVGLLAAPMDQFFDLYRQDGSGLGLRAWINQRYPDVYRRLKSARQARAFAKD